MNVFALIGTIEKRVGYGYRTHRMLTFAFLAFIGKFIPLNNKKPSVGKIRKDVYIMNKIFEVIVDQLLENKCTRLEISTIKMDIILVNDNGHIFIKDTRLEIDSECLKLTLDDIFADCKFVVTYQGDAIFIEHADAL